MALFIVERVGTGFTVRPGENTMQAAASALTAAAWAEGTLPGGAGTKSAKEHATDAAQSATYAGGFETPEYASQAAGEAATTEGDIFRVPLGTDPQTFAWYRRKASGSEAVSPLATTAALAASGGAGLVGAEGGGTVQGALNEVLEFSAVKYGALPGAANATATTAALNAANAAAHAVETATGRGGVVTLPAGVYYIDGPVTFDRMVDFRGAGKFQTRIIAAHVSAKFVVGPRGWGSGQDGVGGAFGGMRLDGASLADELLVVGRCVSRRFHDIEIGSAAGRGLVLEGTQNCTFNGVEVSKCGTDGLTVDMEAGGNLFIKCEVNLNGRSNLRLRQSVTPSAGYLVPKQNTFINCLFEGFNPTTSVAGRVAAIDHGAASSTVLINCVATLLTHATDAGATDIPVIWMHRENPTVGEVSAGLTLIGNCDINGSFSTVPVGYGLVVENSPGAPSRLNVYMPDGTTTFTSCDTAIRAGVNSKVETVGFNMVNVTNRFGAIGGAHTEASVVCFRSMHHDITATDTTVAALVVRGVSGSHTGPIMSFYGSAGLVGSITNAGSLNLTGTAGFAIFSSSSRGTAAAPAHTFTNDADTGMWSATTNTLNFATAGVDRMALTGDGAIEIPELGADPAAPAANKARLFARDNGAGKTQVCVRFPTGAVQVLSTEP